jgi:hypothetical protein
MTHKTIIYNTITIDNDKLTELQTHSGLDENEIVNRLQQIYIQTNAELTDIIDNFVKNEYNTLNTIKSFYTSIIQKTENRAHSSKSINQLRMSEIRKYMDERENIKASK